MSGSNGCCNNFSHQKIAHSYYKFYYNILLLCALALYCIVLFLNPTKWTIYLYIISYLILGEDVLRNSVKSLVKKDFFNENTLMSLATLGAFFLGEYQEAVGVMLFYKIGELLQEKAVNNSKKNIQSLFKLQPNTAWVYRQQTWVEQNPKDITINECILVKKGEKIPLDGIITNGESDLDTSSLTGESLPVHVSIGALVYSGSINLGYALEIKVTKNFQDSSMQKLIQLVEDANEKKSPTEKFITRFARIYTPIVFFIALMIWLVPVTLLNGDWHIWLEKSIIFLVISCPCALVLSVPLSFFSGLGVASQYGILIKSGEYLETLSKIKNIALDKTGTLTCGELSISEITLWSEYSQQECLEYLAVAESFSSHPIALSIKKEYENLYGPIKHLSVSIVEIPGKGIKTQIQQKEILIGSESLMQDHNILLPITTKPQSLGTHIYLAIEQKIACILVIKDTLKESTPSTIKHLKQLGLHISILSGDNKDIVELIANNLNIQDFKSNLLPQDKVIYIEQLKQKALTAFVGDGLNDAPSLIVSDLGIAMGKKGADLSIEAADIVNMDDDLAKIPIAIKIGKKTVLLAKQNIILALSTKVIIMVLTLLGYSNLWLGIFSDVGVALLTIVNTSRIQNSTKIPS